MHWLLHHLCQAAPAAASASTPVRFSSHSRSRLRRRLTHGTCISPAASLTPHPLEPALTSHRLSLSFTACFSSSISRRRRRSSHLCGKSFHQPVVTVCDLVVQAFRPVFPGLCCPQKEKEVIDLQLQASRCSKYNKEPGKRKRSGRTSSSNPFSCLFAPCDRSQSPDTHWLEASVSHVPQIVTRCLTWKEENWQEDRDQASDSLGFYFLSGKRKIWPPIHINMTVLSNDENVQEHVSIENLRIIYSSCFT